MDISKLPRMSQTPPPPPNDPGVDAPDAPPAGAAFPVVNVASPAAAGAPSATSWCMRCNAPNPAGMRFCGSCGAELGPVAGIDYRSAGVQTGPGVGAEVWLSAIVGVVLILMGRNFASWAITTLAGYTFHTGVNWTAGPKAGTEVDYWDLQGYTALQEAGLFLFGLAMVLEAIVLWVVHSRVRAKRLLLAFALSVTLMATAMNLLVSIKQIGFGLLPLWPMLAVAFGGYIAAYEWRLFNYFRPVPQQQA
jgi:hypothetical protein